MVLALIIFAACIIAGAWAARRAACTPPHADPGWATHLVTIGAAKLDHR